MSLSLPLLFCMQGSYWWLGNCEWHKTPWEYPHWQSKMSRKGWKCLQENFSKGPCSCKQSFWYTPWDNIISPYACGLYSVSWVKSLTLGSECLLMLPLKIWFQLPHKLVPDLLHEFELGVWKAEFTHLICILQAISSDLVQTLNHQ